MTVKMETDRQTDIEPFNLSSVADSEGEERSRMSSGGFLLAPRRLYCMEREKLDHPSSSDTAQSPCVCVGVEGFLRFMLEALGNRPG
jgi:hypothetical protein